MFIIIFGSLSLPTCWLLHCDPKKRRRAFMQCFSSFARYDVHTFRMKWEAFCGWNGGHLFWLRVNMRGNHVGISRLTIVAPNVILLSLVKIWTRFYHSSPPRFMDHRVCLIIFIRSSFVCIKMLAWSYRQFWKPYVCFSLWCGLDHVFSFKLKCCFRVSTTPGNTGNLLELSWCSWKIL